MDSTDRSGSVFDGPGEVRGLLRAADWAATPLGTVDAWSPVLRTMVRSCLNSGFPVLIHWGPEYVAVYNDAAAALPGGKHPAALGRPARATWPESWDRVEARLRQVMLAKGLRSTPESAANIAQDLQRVKWFLWHGNVSVPGKPSTTSPTPTPSASRAN